MRTPPPISRLLALALASTACASSGNQGTAEGSAGTSTGATATEATSTEPSPSTTAVGTDAMTGIADDTTTTTDPSTGDPPVLDIPPPDELPPGCVPESAGFMFLLDQAGGLHRFDPATLIREPLGMLACPGATTPFGLTIDRSGTLWLLAADDTGQRLLFTVDPATLGCDLLPFVDPLPQGFAAIALAFGADAPGAEDETLYLTGLLSAEPIPSPDTPAGLARVDARTLTVETIGTLVLPNGPAYELCDLKGSGDARLFAFCSTTPATVAEVEESDASFVLAEPLDIDTGASGAFAVWEGGLWLFTATGPDGLTQVSTYTLGSGTTEVVVDDLGIVVVGAANSTCVPYEPAG